MVGVGKGVRPLPLDNVEVASTTQPMKGANMTWKMKCFIAGALLALMGVAATVLDYTRAGTMLMAAALFIALYPVFKGRYNDRK